MAIKFQFIFVFLLCAIISCLSSSEIHVFQYIINHWGNMFDGDMQCGKELKCIWKSVDQIVALAQHHNAFWASNSNPKAKTLSLYNIHSIWERERLHKPPTCLVNANLTMVESEESVTRYSGLFQPSFYNYDGYSTTHPSAAVQRVYAEAFMQETDFLPNHTSADKLVEGGAYVASDCHRHDNANAHRDEVVKELRSNGIRIDGLGRCMHTEPGPEGIVLPNSRDTRYNLVLKKQVLAKYMFTMAFENSIEPGYVTEKPFDALTAGLFIILFLYSSSALFSMDSGAYCINSTETNEQYLTFELLCLLFCMCDLSVACVCLLCICDFRVSAGIFR